MKPRLIDANTLKERAQKLTLYDDGGWDMTVYAVPVEEIDKAPTIEAEPRAEVAREIFVEIEKCLDGTNILFTSDLIKLKKKYTEGEK